jgi:WXG100 family type VII secretion target
MTAFDVSVPALVQAAAASDSVALDLRADLDWLRAEAEAVLADEWLGRAAASFADGWREWHRDAGAVIAALDELAEALRCSANAYEHADTSGRATLQLATS